jgi:hypothetical protein
VALLTCKVYVVVVAGFTVIPEVVAPVLQEYDIPPEAFTVVEVPAQTVVGPLNVTVGKGFTVTLTAVSLKQPVLVFVI